ncbi:MAG TPA: hypothetical protein VGR95_19100 [Thermoanaerobaculia bacterium]|jgi:hypothetical protein|nr:hypothetical protein [Thermoanaerobaculia bacterium]
MKRIYSSYVQSAPVRRPLKIFASDPMVGTTAPRRISIEVANEPNMVPGPSGERIEVMDYDGAHDRFYPPLDLNERAVLMQNGLDPTESDPRFHQQMVYAVASKTLENFDFALGRQLSLRRRGRPKLRLFPHAFHGANAFYAPDLHAILFGYFRADRENPGQNMPGQNIFTCLSHDIIAHETTHAIVHRLRRYFLEPSNRDVLAFHEGFSDLVALFQHFSYRDLLRDEIQKVRTDIRRDGMLVRMAQQFGEATGMGRELRSALGKQVSRLDNSIVEPHRRGSILVAAVFDAFFSIYQRRIADLIRIATGGTGNLPDGDLHPDLVSRVSEEASRTAQTVLVMCIRAFDYLPPVDITFGDYLRALVTADYELLPQDDLGRRAAVIGAFRNRGIYPRSVPSLAEESLLWEENPGNVQDLPMETADLQRVLLVSASNVSRQVPTSKSSTKKFMAEENVSDEGVELEINKEVVKILHTWATQPENMAALSLSPAHKVEVHGFHPVYRVASDGKLLIELVAHFAQQDRTTTEEFGGIPFRGGTTIVASVDGQVRYVIAKPIATTNRDGEAEARLHELRTYLRELDGADPLLPYGGPTYTANRMKLRMNLAALHGGY